MCYAYGSIDQAIGVCPMCKVFKPSGARCPHVKDVCHNRTLHPRHDVVYLKNAEVQIFNGCGFCKWARTTPPPKLSGYQNPGWPGCCRAPNASEHRMIQAADWPAVSVVHHVAIPTEIKSLLDSVSSRGSPVPANGGRGSGGSPSMPPLDRKNSANSSPSNKPATPGKTSPMVIPSKGRSGGSPQQIATPLSGTISRGTGANAMPSSVTTASAMEQFHNQRRQTITEPTDKRPEQHQLSQSSPGRRNADLEGSVARRNSGRRPTVSAAAPSMSVSKVTVDAQPQHTPLGRRTSISSSGSQSPKSSSPPSRSGDHQSGSVASRTHTKRPSLEVSMTGLKISSSPSSSTSSSSSEGSSHGSMTDSTVTSDGGFTDYLSDESEAELQRQAEAKAALVAQNQAEEMEFRAARQQLTHVDLRPPKTWNPAASGSVAQRLQGSA